MQSSSPIIFRIGIFVAVTVMALFALGWYWNRPEPNIRGSHDHGENLVHSHEHTHRGALSHDHDHPNMSDVTHSHSHEHGHSHQTASKIDPVGKLFEVGHIHGDDVIVYWVDASQSDREVRLQFYAESAGEIKKIDLNTDTLAGESFVELKSQGPVIFTRQGNQFVGELPFETPDFYALSIMVSEIEIGKESFELKFQLPAESGVDEN